jgi:hypothetical protein
MSDNEKPFIRPRTRNVRAARERRIREFAEVQRRRREWINFCEIREWYRNATGRTARDGEEALRAAVEAGDFEGPTGRSRIMYLEPYLRLMRMRRRLTRDMLQQAIATDDSTIWNVYLACCWISRDDARAWFENQNIELPAVLLKLEKRAPELPKGGGLAQADLALLEEMAALIKEDPTLSVEAAAAAVAARAEGGGTTGSKQTRLAKRYRIQQRASERHRSE